MKHTDRLIEFRVEPSMYGCIGSSDLFSSLDGAAFDLARHYYGECCARYWLALCQTPEYGHHDLVQLIDRSCPDMLTAVIGNPPETRGVDLLSLGPGDGHVDVLIMRHLQRVAQVVRYCAVDCSFDLLRCALTRVLDASQASDTFPVQAVCGDFRKPGTWQAASDSDRRLILLTGFTLGNYEENRLLMRIQECMRPGDYLFLDARLHELGNWDDSRELTAAERIRLVRGYDSLASQRFAFGPVETATVATASDVRFGYKIKRGITTIPGAINVTTTCFDLHTRMRLTGQSVELASVDLGSSTVYDSALLLESFAMLGFDPCWHKHSGGTGLYLLRRPEAARVGEASVLRSS